VIVHLNSDTWAEGEPVELGIFVSAYMTTTYRVMRQEEMKIKQEELINKIADSFKGVKIDKIQKDGGQKDDGEK